MHKAGEGGDMYAFYHHKCGAHPTGIHKTECMKDRLWPMWCFADLASRYRVRIAQTADGSTCICDIPSSTALLHGQVHLSVVCRELKIPAQC